MDLSLIPPLQILIAPIKVVEVFSFLLIALIVKKRGGKPLRDQFYLNRTMFYTFISWVVYISVDLVIYLFAALSFDLAVPTPSTGVTGYDLAYPSLLIANILRDVGMAAGLLNALFIFGAAYQVRFGRARFQKKISRNPLAIIIIGLFTAFTIFFDQIKVTITSTSVVKISATFADLALIFLSVIIAIYIYGAITFRTSIFKGIKEADDRFKSRLQYLSIGVLLMGIGHAYWVLTGAIGASDLIFKILGHLIWVISPLLMYVALRGNMEPLNIKSF